MKTDALIEVLVQDAKAVRHPVERQFAVMAAVGLLLAATGFAWALGPRQDIVVALSSPFFLLKMVVVLLLALTTFPTLSAGASPGSKVPVQLIAWCRSSSGPDRGRPGDTGAGAIVAPPDWRQRLRLPLGPADALGLAAGLGAGGPAPGGSNPARSCRGTGGLFAGSLGAILYSVYCTDDSPLFVATWYPLAIGLVSLRELRSDGLFRAGRRRK